MKSKDLFNKFRRVEELADRLSQIEQIEEGLEEGSIVGIFATNIQAIQYHEPKKVLFSFEGPVDMSDTKKDIIERFKKGLKEARNAIEKEINENFGGM